MDTTVIELGLRTREALRMENANHEGVRRVTVTCRARIATRGRVAAAKAPR